MDDGSWFILENIIHDLRVLKTNEPRGLFGLSNCLAFGLTGAEKHGAPGALNSHIPCQSLSPFSNRKFWKSDSFK